MRKGTARGIWNKSPEQGKETEPGHERGETGEEQEREEREPKRRSRETTWLNRWLHRKEKLWEGSPKLERFRGGGMS